MPRYAVFDSHDEFDVVKCPRFVTDTREKAFALSRIIKITDKYVSFVWVVDYRRDIPKKEMNGSVLSFDCMNGTAKSGPVVIHRMAKEAARVYLCAEEFANFRVQKKNFINFLFLCTRRSF